MREGDVCAVEGREVGRGEVEGGECKGGEIEGGVVEGGVGKSGWYFDGLPGLLPLRDCLYLSEFLCIRPILVFRLPMTCSKQERA